MKLPKRIKAIVGIFCAMSIYAVSSGAAQGNNACGPLDQHEYSYRFLETKSKIWSGGRTEISVPGSYLPVGPARSHLLNFIGATTTEQSNSATPCSSASAPSGVNNCQIQGGVGVGRIYSQQQSSSSLYVEKQDVSGYVDLYYPYSQNSSANLGTNTSFKVLYTGNHPVINGYQTGEFVMYFDNHTGQGYQAFGQAYLPNYFFARIDVVLEAYSAVHGYCPVVNPYEYYGQNNYPKIEYSNEGAGTGYQSADNGNSQFYGQAVVSPNPSVPNGYFDPNSSFYPAYELTVGDPSRWKAEGN